MNAHWLTSSLAYAYGHLTGFFDHFLEVTDDLAEIVCLEPRF